MKTKKLSTLIGVFVVTLVVFASCTKQPSAYFSYSPSNPNAGETVKFHDGSSDAYSYDWQFGDGSSSSSSDPSHVYSKGGNYSVKLNVYSKNGKKSDSYYQNIKVNETGDMMFWTDASTQYVIDVTFRGSEKTISSYYTSTPSNCGATGCATFENVPAGVYSYYAENVLYYWEGTVTVLADQCSKMLLYASKATRKDNPAKSNEKLVEGIED